MEKLKATIDKYRWYHTIKVADGVYTTSDFPHFSPIWDFSLECMKNIDFKNNRVLDIGCRDGLFSFEAEKRGAREIIGIDNDISEGAVEFLIPFFRSKVQMYELNLYDLTPEKFGLFDIVMFLGVLYHLRYPFWGLKKVVDCLSDGGILLLEGGMLVDETLENKELLYCPVQESPYEPTSCSFFNRKGLSTTLHSLQLKVLDSWTINLAKKTPHSGFMREVAKRCMKYCARKIGFSISRVIKSCAVTRQFFILKKDTRLKVAHKRMELEKTTDPDIRRYWDEIHDIHTKKSKKIR